LTNNREISENVPSKKAYTYVMIQIGLQGSKCFGKLIELKKETVYKLCSKLRNLPPISICSTLLENFGKISKVGEDYINNGEIVALRLH